MFEKRQPWYMGVGNPGQSDADWWVLKGEESELQPEISDGKETIPDSSQHVDFFDYFSVVISIIGGLYILNQILSGEWCFATGIC
tara:strand:- start:1041 stop:1295 length:255 start_codon:yes stop_codon:yes gene_type:complete